MSSVNHTFPAFVSEVETRKKGQMLRQQTSINRLVRSAGRSLDHLKFASCVLLNINTKYELCQSYSPSSVNHTFPAFVSEVETRKKGQMLRQQTFLHRSV
jgi:hypothetical protein